LGFDHVGIHDNFLELGGDSLLATRIISQVMTKFKVDLPVDTLFESPTLAKMAQILLMGQAKTIGKQGLSHLLSELESLSDEEVRNRLTNKNS
jgi:aryl carrier-like protein